MNDDIYFNNPMSFVPKIEDEDTLDLLRHHSQIHITAGRGAYERPDASQRLSSMLWDKGIWNDLDLWGYDMKHDWPTWRAMLPYFLEKMGY